MTSSSETTVAARSPEDREPGARRVVLASFVGTAVEWYDYFLYGAMAALVFGPLFFPASDPAVGQLAALTTFAVGFLARPLGGAVAGHLGDRFGRKRILVASLLVMGGTTVLVGALPVYAQVGVWAPVALVVLRLVQGLAVGAEWGGAALMAVEHAPARRRGVFGAAPQLGVPVGAIGANVVVLVASSTTREAFVEWGWRIGFLASAVLVVVGLAIRRGVAESPLFEEAGTRGGTSRAPLAELLRTHRRTLVLSIALGSGPIAFGYLVLVFVLSYGSTNTTHSRTVLLLAVTVSCVVMFLGVIGFSWLSDRVGRRRMMIVGGVAQIGVGLVFFPVFDVGPAWGVFRAPSLAMFALSMQYGPLGALLAEQFPTRIRYCGVSLSYQGASTLGGALAPVIGTALVTLTGVSLWVGVYIAVMALISLGAAWLVTETGNVSLRALG